MKLKKIGSKVVGAHPWRSSPSWIREYTFPSYERKHLRQLEPRVVRTRYLLTDQVFETILMFMVINNTFKSASSSSSLVWWLKWKIQCKFRECFTKNYCKNEGLFILRLFIFIREKHLKVEILQEKVICRRMKIKYVATTLMILICTGKIFRTGLIKDCYHTYNIKTVRLSDILFW